MSGNLRFMRTTTGRSVEVSTTDPIPSMQSLLTTNDMTGLRINTAALGDTALVSATASHTTRVHALRLNVAGAVIVQIRDGATVLEVFNFGAAGGSAQLEFRDRPYYVGTVNTALNINLSAAVQVDGRIEYVKSA